MNFESPDLKEEFKTIEGKKYKKVFTGYTVRQYYSHTTPEKGAGPGWDRFVSSPDWVAEKYGVDVDGMKILSFRPDDLPDEPHYVWEEVTED